MGEGAAPEGARKKLPVLATAWESYLSAFRNLRALLILGAIPAALFFGGELTNFAYLAEATLSPGPRWDTVALYLAAGFGFGYLGFVYFAVAWHRFILTGNSQSEVKLLRGWQSAHWRYLGALLAVFYLPVIAVALVMFPLFFLVGSAFGHEPPSAVGIVYFGVMLLVGIWWWSRFTLMLPSCALGQRFSPFKAWKASRGNSLRILVALLLAYILPMLLFALLRQGINALWATSYIAVVSQGVGATTEGFSFMQLTPFAAFLAAIDVLASGLFVGFLSIAFRDLASWTLPEEPVAPQAAV